MSIPLDTYDPDWEAKYEELRVRLETVNRQPYSDARSNLVGILSDELNATFHSQFRTTGEYALFMQRKAAEAIEFERLPELEIEVPEFPEDGSVDQSQHLYELFTEKVRNEAKAIRGMLPLDFPSAGETFAKELGDSETQAMGTEILEGFYSKSSYSYLIEKRGPRTNICFFQIMDGGTTPMNYIKELATQLYDRDFGPTAMAQGKTYVPPENIYFYVYIPPRVPGGEKFMQADMLWNKQQLRYEDTQWYHKKSVPYVLRKQAAIDGLARDPDVPVSPRRKPSPRAGTEDHELC